MPRRAPVGSEALAWSGDDEWCEPDRDVARPDGRVVAIRGNGAAVKIRVMSVTEGVVYHCWPVDRSNPCRPELEVDAAVQPGDVDSGPLLLSVADYIFMAGGPEIARPCLQAMERQGRLVDEMGVPHIAFPMWTPIDLSGPPRSV